MGVAFPCVGGPVGVAYAVREAPAGPSGGRRNGNDVKPSVRLCV